MKDVEMKERGKRSFATRAVHTGERPPVGRHSPVVSPIHPAVSYVYDSADELEAVLGAHQEGYVYHRYGNPTVAAFERVMADLEGGEAALAFSSGMAAIHAALLAAGVRAGTTIVAATDLYGATFSLVGGLLNELGAAVHWVDVSDLRAVARAMADGRPAVLVAETISNPLLKVADISALAELAHDRGAALLIDNTFASPWLCNPLAQGADMVAHSATKYIGGHGDVMAGVVVTSAETRSALYELNKLVGGVLGPFEAWLAMRGLKTLPLRMPRHCNNAMQVAAWLAGHPKVAHVNYPGLPAHPHHVLAGRILQGRGYGGVLSCVLAGADRATVFRFMERLELCLPATSLGDIYTLVLHPATASHRSLTPAERAQVGIDDGLIRISVGIEDPGDIIADLERALDGI
jgi:cystathionine beta-lyase/cystathionine gamma-synthase